MWIELPIGSSHLDLDLDLILDLHDHVIDVPGRMVYTKCLIGDICAMNMHDRCPKSNVASFLSPRYLPNPASVCFLLLNKPCFQSSELRKTSSGYQICGGGKITDRYGAHT